MDNYHEKREMNKFALDSYLEDYEFPNLENLLKDAIDSLHNQFEKASNEYKKVQKSEMKVDLSDIFFYEDEISSIQERLLSVYEMIIVNDYKEFELVLKRLLMASLNFDEKEIRDFVSIKSLLKSKGINVSELRDYNDINDLRKINNHIKHSKIHEIPDDLKQILEFRKKKNFTYIELMNFHNRIKDLRYKFILDLKGKIYSYLYNFDENRITNIALELIKRMSNSHVNLLIKKLIELK